MYFLGGKHELQQYRGASGGLRQQGDYSRQDLGVQEGG